MKTIKWEKINLKVNGEIVEASAPVIISASRATDIPAFYSDWFFDSLKKGYVVWTNPFNNKKSYVSFEKTRLVVFWTKNPKPIIPQLKYLDEKNINYYFQFTLNDYEKENFEPNVPPLKERVSTFKKLSKLIGKEKVIWRFDPLILTDSLGIDELEDRINNVAKKIYKYTEKLVFSFADISIYSKVKNNLKRKNVNYLEFDDVRKVEMAKRIAKISEKYNLVAATCAENFGLEKFNIKHNKCIDDNLIVRLFGNDNELMEFLGYQNNLFEVDDLRLKDKGQREDCHCIVSKDIGQYNTCLHLCVYCYANYSEERVLENSKKFRDGILG